jgi:hypothetical protein
MREKGERIRNNARYGAWRTEVCAMTRFRASKRSYEGYVDPAYLCDWVDKYKRVKCTHHVPKLLVDGHPGPQTIKVTTWVIKLWHWRMVILVHKLLK